MKTVWGLTSKIGVRPVSWLGIWYTDTYFNFDERSHPSVRGSVALTIDDGLCRQDPSFSMTEEVRELLQKHGAQATFFLCGNYVKGSKLEAEARTLLADGHEFGNHCSTDGEFASLAADAFEADVRQTSETLEALIGEPGQIRWFRAPQAKYTRSMREVTERMGMKHALGDCYCDDWMIDDSAWIAQTLLNQVRDGSVIILHMPERGFREHVFLALELFLQGLAARNLRAVTLSHLAALAGVPGMPPSPMPGILDRATASGYPECTVEELVGGSGSNTNASGGAAMEDVMSDAMIEFVEAPVATPGKIGKQIPIRNTSAESAEQESLTVGSGNEPAAGSLENATLDESSIISTNYRCWPQAGFSRKTTIINRCSQQAAYAAAVKALTENPENCVVEIIFWTPWWRANVFEAEPGTSMTFKNGAGIGYLLYHKMARAFPGKSIQDVTNEQLSNDGV